MCLGPLYGMPLYGPIGEHHRSCRYLLKHEERTQKPPQNHMLVLKIMTQELTMLIEGVPTLRYYKLAKLSTIVLWLMLIALLILLVVLIQLPYLLSYLFLITLLILLITQMEVEIVVKFKDP